MALVVLQNEREFVIPLPPPEIIDAVQESASIDDNPRCYLFVKFVAAEPMAIHRQILVLKLPCFGASPSVTYSVNIKSRIVAVLESFYFKCATLSGERHMDGICDKPVHCGDGVSSFGLPVSIHKFPKYTEMLVYPHSLYYYSSNHTLYTCADCGYSTESAVEFTRHCVSAADSDRLLITVS